MPFEQYGPQELAMLASAAGGGQQMGIPMTMPQEGPLMASAYSPQDISMLSSAAGGVDEVSPDVEIKISNKSQNASKNKEKNKTTATTPNQLSATPPGDVSQQLLAAMSMSRPGAGTPPPPAFQSQAMESQIDQLRAAAGPQQMQEQVNPLAQYGEALSSQQALPDLSSIASLVDAWTGSNFASTYKPPPSTAPKEVLQVHNALVKQRTEQAEKKKEALAKANGLQYEYDKYKQDLTFKYDKLREDGEKTDLLANKIISQQTIKSNELAQKQKDAEARAELEREKLEARNEIERMKADNRLAALEKQIASREKLATLAWESKAKLADKKIAAAMAGKDSKFNEGQWKAAGFATRMANANQMLTNDIYSDPAKLQEITGAWSSFQKNWAPEGWRSDVQKMASQAELDFVTAVLRRESGAAISATEFETERNKYFPRWGDPPEVVARKNDSRARVSAIMRAESAGAIDKFEELYPEFKTKGGSLQDARKSGPPPTYKVGQIHEYNGGKYRFKGGDPTDQNNYEKI